MRNNIQSSPYQLHEIGFLTQDNFDYILKHAKTKGFPFYATSEYLKPVNACTLENFKCVVEAGIRSDAMAELLGGLHKLNLLNAENRQMAVKYRILPDILPILGEMKNNDELPRDMSEVVMWNGSEALQPLTHVINDMFAHGLFLLTNDLEKAKVAMFLAVELKQALKAFMELSPEQRNQKTLIFKNDFIQKLHSKDHIMSIHREYWKVIVANILIAITGIGLLALGVN